MTTQAQSTFRLHPRAVYWLDTVVSFIMGVAVAAAAGPLTTLIGWPLPTTFLLLAGLVLIPWAAYNFWTARASRVGITALTVHLLVDAAWVAASLGLLVAYGNIISPMGFALVLVQAIAVAGVAVIKLASARALLA